MTDIAKPQSDTAAAPAREGDAEARAAPGDGAIVLGIGYGDTQALLRVLAAMPPGHGLALVLLGLEALPPEALADALQPGWTPLLAPDLSARRMPEANQLWLLPPSWELVEADGGILAQAVPAGASGYANPIDVSLDTLGAVFEEASVGILLSGQGTAGTLGLRAIKAAGGLVVVQDPRSAEHAQMPRQALSAGLADAVLRPEEIPDQILRYLEHLRRAIARGQRPPRRQEHDALGRILALLYSQTRYDFRSYRRRMLLRRIERRMGLCHLDRVEDYLKRLHSNPDEPRQLVRDLLIGVTGFFRDPAAFERLAEEVIVPLVEQCEKSGEGIRAWVPGCATGEEAYSIAMLLLEACENRHLKCAIQVFATDIDHAALDIARHGVYPATALSVLDAKRLARFFIETDDQGYRVTRQLRETVLFAPHNLLDDAPFSRLDLISCRNLLIYLEPDVQRKLISLFHFALRPGGALFLGPSESLGRHQNLFETLSKPWRLHRRLDRGRTSLPELLISGCADRSSPMHPHKRPLALSDRQSIAELVERQLLTDYAPAAVLIDRHYRIQYFFGRVSQYLHLPTGAPTADLMAMLHPDLRIKLGAACQKVEHQGLSVILRQSDFERNGQSGMVEIRISPLQLPLLQERMLLVTFRDLDMSHPVSQILVDGRDPCDDASLAQLLEFELKATRENLQSTIEQMERANEELKSSNEEMMSMNEELQSANEELETSREELQSLNEELYTVNSQLQEKVDELERINNDITNLIGNTDIATIFLDSALGVKFYTPPAADLFNLRPTDIGRLLSDLAPAIKDAELFKEARAVMEQLVPIEKELRSEDGRCLLRRIRSYRTLDNRIDGVVISFVDISSRVRTEQLLRESEAELKRLNLELEARIAERTAELSAREHELSLLAANVPAMFCYVDRTLRYQYVNRRYAERFGHSMQDILGRRVPDVLGARNFAVIEPYLMGALQGVEQRFQYDIDLPDGAQSMDVVYVPDRRTRDGVQGLFVLMQDISEFKALERQLYVSEQRLRAIVATAADGIITINAEGAIQDFNAAANRLFGRSAEEMVGHNIRELLPNDSRLELCLSKLLAEPKREHDRRSSRRPLELMGQRADGSSFPVELTLSAVDGLDLMVAILRDVSERRQLEREIIEISTAEQERIGHDIHDGIGQQLTALGMLATSLERRLRSAGKEAEASDAHSLVVHLDETLTAARALARGLSPVEIAPDGLAAALGNLVERIADLAGIDCDCRLDPRAQISDPLMAVHLYRIAQEALTNAVRHAQARHIDLWLGLDQGNNLVLAVRDDGSGIDLTQDRRGRLGLHIMEYRAALIGGRLRIERSPGDQGTQVRCQIPTSGL